MPNDLLLDESSLDGPGVSRAREEPAALLARAAATRRASRRLANDALTVRAWSELFCQLSTDRYEQWERWHAGIAALTESTDGHPECRVLRICMGCDAVCFSPSDRPADERWVDPPERIRERLRGGWRGVMLSHGLCPTCLPMLYPDLVSDSHDVPRAEAIANVHA